MNNGYQDFFKKAKQNSKAQSQPVKIATKQNVKLKASKPTIKRNNISSKLLSFVFVGLVVTLLAFFYVDDLDAFLSRVEISFLSPAKAEGGEVKPAENKNATTSDKPETAATEKSEVAAGAATEQKDYSEAELNHFARLRERKNELDQREKDIQKMEIEIGKQKEEIEKKMAELEEMRKKISSVLEDKVQIDDKRIENLVQFYSSMKPQQAAKIIESIDEGLAVEVLARMKKKSAADIMNLLKAEKAQVISEKYAGYRK
jgi:flagellar motility protein MotE (MotC chaperone)